MFGSPGKLLQWENTAPLMHSSDLTELFLTYKNLNKTVWQFLNQSINVPQIPLKPQNINIHPVFHSWQKILTVLKPPLNKPCSIANENKVKKCLDQLQEFFLITCVWRFPQTDTELGEQRELYRHPWHPDLGKCRQVPTFPAVAVVTQPINTINFHLSL